MNLMIFEKLVDHRDRKKIKKRTQENVQGYDYRLNIKPEPTGPGLSFLVLGDSGSGGKDKQKKFYVANEMADEDPDLILHLGDVVYLHGSREGYPDRFIKPYHHWLKNGETSDFDDLVFTIPFLPIYGNHDYYDFLRFLPGIRRILGAFIKSFGSGSRTGEVFEEAFVAKRPLINAKKMDYIPRAHTKLPNRYYWFTYGPCAFYALDSNTLDSVGKPSKAQKAKIKAQIKALEASVEVGQEKIDRFERLVEKDVLTEELKDQFEDLLDELIEQEKLLQLLKKRRKAKAKDHDKAQLEWLQRVLHHEEAKDKWKIVYMHHSLYTSESGHIDDRATGGLHDNLRNILVDGGVHLVLSGHSHCFEWCQTLPPEEGLPELERRRAEKERKMCYLVSGGGGRGLRRSVFEDSRTDQSVLKKQEGFLQIAESKAYTAIFNEDDEIGIDGRAVHNFLKITADENGLTVFPVGVSGKGETSERLPNFMTKVYTPVQGGHEMVLSRLDSIEIKEGLEPKGNFKLLPDFD